MAVFDTAENGRTNLTQQTLDCLLKTVNWHRHRITIVNNASCPESEMAINAFCYRVNGVNEDSAKALHLTENIGTARAINAGWKERKQGEHCIKIDNDVVIHANGWVDEMEDAIKRFPQIGIIGLKRKDLLECTTYPDENFRSHLVQLPHEPVQTWITIEQVRGVMGTCVMVNSALIDRIGYLSQPTVYGFDDSIYSCRSSVAGFVNCFLPHINIDHIDPGGNDYTEWKRRHAGETMRQAEALISEYMNGQRPLYEPA